MSRQQEECQSGYVMWLGLDRISNECIRKVTNGKTRKDKLRRFGRIEGEYQWDSQEHKRNKSREKLR